MLQSGPPDMRPGSLIMLENMELFNQLNVLTQIPNPVTFIYVTQLTHDQIIADLQNLLGQLNVQVPAAQVLLDAIRSFNAAPRPLVDFQNQLFVPLLVNGSVPFKVQLKKLFEGPSVYLDRSAKSRHVFV